MTVYNLSNEGNVKSQVIRGIVPTPKVSLKKSITPKMSLVRRVELLRGKVEEQYID